MKILKDDPEETQEDEQVSIPETLPVLPLPDVVVFPYMIVPLFVNREQSIQAVDRSLAENRMVLVVSQKTPDVEEPTAEDLYPFGTVSLIMRMLKLPDGRVRILVQGFARASVQYLPGPEPFLQAKVFPESESPPNRSLSNWRPWCGASSRRWSERYPSARTSPGHRHHRCKP